MFESKITGVKWWSVFLSLSR